MPITAMDETLARIYERMIGARGRRTLWMFFAVMLLFGGLAFAGAQLYKLESVTLLTTGTYQDIIFETYGYVLALAWAVGGIACFVVFGWLGMAAQLEHVQLRALYELERARKQSMP